LVCGVALKYFYFIFTYVFLEQIFENSKQHGLEGGCLAEELFDEL
jgi:hypothetical protein